MLLTLAQWSHHLVNNLGLCNSKYIPDDQELWIHLATWAAHPRAVESESVFLKRSQHIFHVLRLIWKLLDLWEFRGLSLSLNRKQSLEGLKDFLSNKEGQEQIVGSQPIPYADAICWCHLPSVTVSALPPLREASSVLHLCPLRPSTGVETLPLPPAVMSWDSQGSRVLRTESSHDSTTEKDSWASLGCCETYHFL